MKRVLLACLIAFGFAAPAQAWWSKGRTPPCDSANVIASVKNKFTYADRRQFHWGVAINQVTDIYETPEFIQNSSLINRRFCRGTAWLTDGRREEVVYLIESKQGLRVDRLARRVVPAGLRPLARLRRLVPLDRTLRRFAAATAALAISTAALAQGEPGDFDFYVLALSWSPSYCATAVRPDPEQCDVERARLRRPRPLAAIRARLSGILRRDDAACREASSPGSPISCLPAWPSINGRSTAFVRGCGRSATSSSSVALTGRSTSRTSTSRFAMMPRQARSNWRKTSSLRTLACQAAGSRSPATGPGAVEVRICLTKRLDFRRCTEVDEDACRQRTITLPAVE